MLNIKCPLDARSRLTFQLNHHKIKYQYKDTQDTVPATGLSIVDEKGHITECDSLESYVQTFNHAYSDVYDLSRDPKTKIRVSLFIEYDLPYTELLVRTLVTKKDIDVAVYNYLEKYKHISKVLTSNPMLERHRVLDKYRKTCTHHIFITNNVYIPLGFNFESICTTSPVSSPRLTVYNSDYSNLWCNRTEDGFYADSDGYDNLLRSKGVVLSLYTNYIIVCNNQYYTKISDALLASSTEYNYDITFAYRLAPVPLTPSSMGACIIDTGKNDIRLDVMSYNVCPPAYISQYVYTDKLTPLSPIPGMYTFQLLRSRWMKDILNATPDIEEVFRGIFEMRSKAIIKTLYGDYNANTLSHVSITTRASLEDSDPVHVECALVMMIYLNNDYDGGDITFTGKTPYKQRHLDPGMAIIWPGRCTHPHKRHGVSKGVQRVIMLHID